jgi:hypothetical protein
MKKFLFLPLIAMTILNSCKKDDPATVTTTYNAPVASNDAFNTGIYTKSTFDVLSNDTKGAAPSFDIQKSSVDLDPATVGKQSTFATANGLFTVDTLGNLSFDPINTLSTAVSASCTYNVQSTDGLVSNNATATFNLAINRDTYIGKFYGTLAGSYPSGASPVSISDSLTISPYASSGFQAQMKNNFLNIDMINYVQTGTTNFTWSDSNLSSHGYSGKYSFINSDSMSVTIRRFTYGTPNPDSTYTYQGFFVRQ